MPAQRAKIHLKSGQIVVAHAESFQRTSDVENDLIKFSATKSIDYPLYLRLNDVSAITIERRTLFGWRQK